MRLIVLLALGFLLVACTDNDKPVSCYSSSDYQDFACIKKTDFLSASGIATPQSEAIANCTLLSSTSNACDFNTLPFLATSGTTPTKQQLLDRLIVSHPWMATRFAEMLDQMPPDMYNLFGSVTAIVIHSEIRPAFFWPKTGAIYIDPYYLWATPAEYSTVRADPYFHTRYSDDLLFRSFTRYTLDGDYAFSSNDNTRTPEQALYAISAVLFHELAHARDYFPISGILAANGNATPVTLANTLESQRISLAIKSDFPLTNPTLTSIAEVLYKGAYASPALQMLTAADMGAELESEGANDDYAYSSSAEDIAMLFEETMMKLHFNIDHEIAYATPLNYQQSTCADFTFDWTAINRYASNLVIPRATFVVDGLLPGHNHAVFLANPVADGTFSWCLPKTGARGKAMYNETITRDYWH